MSCSTDAKCWMRVAQSVGGKWSCRWLLLESLLFSVRARHVSSARHPSNLPVAANVSSSQQHFGHRPTAVASAPSHGTYRPRTSRPRRVRNNVNDATSLWNLGTPGRESFHVPNMFGVFQYHEYEYIIGTLASRILRNPPHTSLETNLSDTNVGPETLRGRGVYGGHELAKFRGPHPRHRLQATCMSRRVRPAH